MKTFKYILLIFVFLYNIKGIGQEILGKAKIVKLNNYEDIDEYIPHDCSTKSDMLDEPVKFKKNEKYFAIKNISNNGYSGHSITIILDCLLNITKVEYNEFDDLIDGSTTTFKIDDIELKLNYNPFDNDTIIGYYSIDLTKFYTPGAILNETNYKREVSQRKFMGKFMTCDK